MKKLFLCLFALVCTSTFSFGQKTITLKSAVSESEFKQLDQIDQTIISFLDAGIFALKGMNLNKEFSKKSAVLNLAIKEKKLVSTFTIEDQSSEEPLNAQSCTICDMFSGMRCFRRIREQLENGTIILKVELISDCAVVTWN